MILVTGLGNKGEEYEKTRHNTGLIILDLIKDDSNKKIIFFKPNCFMNESGGPIATIARKNKIKPENVVVIYDDMDIPIGKIKISFNRSSGGHNGVESIIKNLKTEGFLRIRVGISPHTPTGKLKKPLGEKAVLDFLLKDFKASEIAELKKVSKKINEALEMFVLEGKEKMMSIYNAN